MRTSCCGSITASPPGKYSPWASGANGYLLRSDDRGRSPQARREWGGERQQRSWGPSLQRFADRADPVHAHEPRDCDLDGHRRAATMGATAVKSQVAPPLFEGDLGDAERERGFVVSRCRTVGLQ